MEFSFDMNFTELHLENTLNMKLTRVVDVYSDSQPLLTQGRYFKFLKIARRTTKQNFHQKKDIFIISHLSTSDRSFICSFCHNSCWHRQRDKDTLFVIAEDFSHQLNEI